MEVSQAIEPRGRKPKAKSRAAEIRQRLLAWKQIPEALRPSLRELASQLGTSHQLLTHYLQGLDRWQVTEQAKAAREQSIAIRTRAESQSRPLDQIEESAVKFHNLAASWLSIEATLLKNLDQIKNAAKLGPLDWHQFQILKRMVNGQWVGASEAQGLLQKIRMGQIKTLSKRETNQRHREDFKREAEIVFRAKRPDWSDEQIAAAVEEAES
jgi:hypothetical protein